MAKLVTQKDIAKKLGVTRITVSKALNNYSDISESMRRKVKEVAKEAGYIVDHGARSLQMRKTNTVGVVIPEVSNSFFSFVVHGIMDPDEGLNPKDCAEAITYNETFVKESTA
jgi:DNA-binding LacI/PurR family transcriptional regulator